MGGTTARAGAVIEGAAQMVGRVCGRGKGSMAVALLRGVAILSVIPSLILSRSVPAAEPLPWLTKAVPPWLNHWVPEPIHVPHVTGREELIPRLRMPIWYWEGPAETVTMKNGLFDFHLVELSALLKNTLLPPIWVN